MTDDEYRDFLAVLAKKFFRPSVLADPQTGANYLVREIERLQSISRLARVVGEDADNAALVNTLSAELSDARIDGVLEVMERAGVVDALEEAPEIVFGELRRSAIPEEDVHLLRRAGVEDPEVEITLLINYAIQRLAYREKPASEAVQQAPIELEKAAQQLGHAGAPEPPRKKRKLFNGIGKILAGTIMGAGNVLLAAGTVVAPNPATAHLTIGCSALAVASLFQGMGDLRGE
jgi:hypothetical protein